jgi:hypothetical protein
MAETGKKKVVKVEASAKAEKAEQRAEESTPEAANWKPTPEAKGKATTRRIIAIVLWVIAIAGEAFAIFWVLRRPLENGAFPTWAWILLLGILVVIGLLTFGGSQLWKQANRLDPASKANPVRFFVQNQLGAIITIIAFVPLIILIFLNKDMSGKQKGIAGIVGIVLLIVAGYFGTSINSPSVEQYGSETQQVVNITGTDTVFWTKAGKVFHLCSDASAVNLTSKDNTIYSGTVAAAHEAGKQRLTLQVDQETEQCGFTAPTDAPTPDPSSTP